MTRTVEIDGRTVRLTELLGVGGEAEVYALGDRAVKVYHPLDALRRMYPNTPDRVLARRDALRREKLDVFPAGLPGNVVGPLALAHRDGQVAGFVMRRVKDGHDLRLLSRRSLRGTVAGSDIVDILLGLHDTLARLHGSGVVVGDLNDANVLFRDRSVWLIDADSMQFGGLPCPVAAERFLDPRLYGVDLARAPVFDAGSDHFAFAALLTASLLCVGPYGGHHPVLRTWTRRAAAGVWLLDPDVRYPKAALSAQLLPDWLLGYLEAVFSHGDRTPIDRALLAQVRWTRCPQCGLEHARDACPCAARTPGRRAGPTVVHGSLEARRVLRTRGRVVAARLDRGRLHYAVDEGGCLSREDGSVAARGRLLPGMRVEIAGPRTWVGHQRQVSEVREERVRARSATATFDGRPMFRAHASGLLRIADGYLRGREVIGQVRAGQTWFAAGDHLGFGFYRYGASTFFFLFDLPGTHLREVDLPALRGRVLDAACTFDTGQVLFEVSEDVEGRTLNSACVVAADGTVRARTSGSAGDSGLLATTGGKALQGDRVLCGTDDGLLSLRIDERRRALEEDRLYADTGPFVAQGDRLLVSGSTVYVVGTGAIWRLDRRRGS